MGNRAPRYDLPKAAPEPLRQVQRFVNTVDLSHDREWLVAWLAEQGITFLTDADLERARTVREALRELLFANLGGVVADGAYGALAATADRAALTIDFDGLALGVQAVGLDGVLGRIVVVSFQSMLDGSWGRLKCCRNHDCRWAFYDKSRNRSATWCSMQICGNRTKTRSYRLRSRPGAPR
jgi:predicted RNA-binding Zn ribbon-like protein